jgi:hypothetical protein
MGITFVLLVALSYAMSRAYPDSHRPQMPEPQHINMESAPVVKWMAALVVLLTIGLYIVFF